MDQEVQNSMSLANPAPPFMDGIEKMAAAVGGIGLLLLFVAAFGGDAVQHYLFLVASLGLITVGTITFSIRKYLTKEPGIKNNGVFFSSLTHRGLWGWIAGIVITGFYVLLYWAPEFLGLNEAGNSGLVGLFDPLSYFFKGQPASQWFVYGTLYTLAILAFGFKFILKYRHNKYQIIRTISVMFFQLAFAFLLPEIMANFNLPYYDLKNMWPLNYYFFYDWNINGMLNPESTLTSGQTIGLFMLIWGILMIFVISPVLTYFYGKRWYCSWVCGCGGLAETAGDSFRHLSDKSLKAWKLERWIIHLVLVFVTIMTVAVLFSYFQNNGGNVLLSKPIFTVIVVVLCLAIAGTVRANVKEIRASFEKLPIIIYAILGVIALATVITFMTGGSNPFIINGGSLRSTYGFLIGAAFSGVVGVGFYPLMGSRVWCRFGCPMAAILGIQQKFFSRFRITTNGGQCISCGNCSTYCEMGIDVRSYAQKGQNIVRASCVGCGICAAVCPRGVLRLENGSVDIHSKTSELKAIHIAEGDIRIL